MGKDDFTIHYFLAKAPQTLAGRLQEIQSQLDR